MSAPLRHIVAMLLLALTAALWSCSDTGCYDNRSSLPLARFYTVSESGTVSAVSISGLTVRGVDVPGDSLLVDGDTRSEVYLPLRSTVTTTQYALTFTVSDGDGNATMVNDTITIDYRPVAYFDSRECGAMYNFELNDVRSTSHVIDSVVAVQTTITNAVRESLRIYVTP